jgi:peptidoglycan/LPS O-acetylase OafA/YrhL
LGITLALLLSLPVAWLLHFCIDFTLNKLSGSKKEA